MGRQAAQTGFTTSVILFTDIVDSTVVTQRVGDAAFRDRSRTLEERVRDIVRLHHGTPVEGRTLGDGVLAMFGSAEQAIEAAIGCSTAGADLDLALHLGLHAGDVIREQDNVYGVAVNIASRISALTAPDEVLVSDVIRSLARASTNVLFVDRGEHALKGVTEAQRLFAVRRQAGDEPRVIVSTLKIAVSEPKPGGLLDGRLRAAAYDVRLQNDADNGVDVQLDAEEPDGRCAFSLTDRVRLPARGAVDVPLKVRPRRRRWRGPSVIRPFTVSVAEVDGSTQAAAAGQFVDRPLGPVAAAGGLLLLAAFAIPVILLPLLLGGGDDSAGASRDGAGAGQPLASTSNARELAFVSSRGGAPAVYVMDADGTAQGSLGRVPGFDSDLSWSADGKRIAYTGKEGADEASDKTSGGSQVGGGGGQGAGGSGGSDNRDIYVMELESSEVRRLTDDAAEDLEPAWTRDGTRLVFTSRRDGNREIYVMNADGSGQTRVTNDPADDFHPAWSPDGARIAFTTTRDGNREIYTMAADGSDPRRLTTHEADDFQSAWSPDGTRIAFSSSRDGNREIYTLNPDGTALVRLTSQRGDDFHPSWSPDGTRIAFTSERDGNREIYLMLADGSGLHRLTEDPAEDSQPVWSAISPGT